MVEHTSGFIDLINGLKQIIQEKDIDTIKNILDNTANHSRVLIDVREADEWDEGYIPGAIHLSKGIIEREIEKVVPEKDREVILYCRGGMRSLIAADSLQKMGYSNVCSMIGGITAWREANYPITDE